MLVMLMVWMAGRPDPSKPYAMIWYQQLADLTLEGKPHPEVLWSIEIANDDRGKSLGHLKMMDRYALPQRFRVAIEGDVTKLVAETKKID